MNYLMLGAISGCLVIILGAFGAHGLKDVLDDYGKSIYNKAVLYHMFHTMSILVLGIINKIQRIRNPSVLSFGSISIIHLSAVRIINHIL